MSSSEAPPPVETCVTLSVRPKLRSADTESPPPTTVVPGRGGDRLGHGAGARRERRQLERSHRAVPEHGAGARDHRRVAIGGPRADVESHPSRRHLDAVDRAHLRHPRQTVAGHEIDRQLQLRPGACAAVSSARPASSTSSGAQSDAPTE